LALSTLLKSAGVKPVRLPPKSPNLNAFCLARLSMLLKANG
jgi:hypothetical protein